MTWALCSQNNLSEHLISPICVSTSTFACTVSGARVTHATRQPRPRQSLMPQHASLPCICRFELLYRAEPLPLSSQDRESDVSGLYGISVKWLHARVSNLCITDTHVNNTHIDTYTRTKRQSKAVHQHAKSRLRSHSWIIFLVMLFLSTLPNFCIGARRKKGMRACELPISHSPVLPNLIYHPGIRTATFSFNLS